MKVEVEVTASGNGTTNNVSKTENYPKHTGMLFCGFHSERKMGLSNFQVQYWHPVCVASLNPVHLLFPSWVNQMLTKG